MLKPQEVLAAVAQNPWTALVFTHDGQVAETIPLDGELTAQAFLEFTRRHAQGRPFRLVQAGQLTDGDLTDMGKTIAADMAKVRAARGRDIKIPDIESPFDPFLEERCIADAFVEFL